MAVVLPPDQQSYIPSIYPNVNSSSSPTMGSYVPGQGYVPNAPQQDFSSYFAQNQNGRSPEQVFAEWQQGQNSFNASNTNMNPNVNSMPSSAPPTAGTSAMQAPLGIYGTPDAPPERNLSARNNSGTVQTGAAGSAVPKSTSSGSGLLSGMSGSMPQQNNTVPNFGTIQSPGGAGVAPQGQMNYGAPGQGGLLQGGAGQLQMQQASPQSAIGQYQNSAGYQLMNDPNSFQQSPGYQYAVDQALGQVQNQASARGLLESGAALRGMTDRAQGMASQEYGNWWNRQNQLYGDYQNRLAGLAGGDTGANNAFATGNNMATNAMNTGTNLGSLFGNQGTAGLGAISNAGAAQANTIMQAGNTQAQIGANNSATMLAGATIGANQQKGLF